MNKITKDSIIYTHPLYGDVTINDILMLLTHITNHAKKFEKLAFDIIKQSNINNNDLSDLIHYTTSSDLDEAIDNFNELIN